MTQERRLRRSRWRRRLFWAAGLVVAYVLVMFPLGCGGMLADKLMLFPSREAVRAPGAREEMVDTPAGRMHVIIARSRPSGLDDEATMDQVLAAADEAARELPARYVLRLEGNGGRAEYTATYIAERWSDVPTEVWAMNHPGFGKSDGPAELRKMAPAALGVYDAICQIAGDRPVYIDADSMGATQALYIAAERQGSRPVAGLVLKNPPPLRQIVMGRFGWWNLWLAAGPIAAGVPKDLDAIASARRVKAPAIFIRAMNDTLVPPGYQQKIIDAYAGEKVVVDFRDAEHNTPLDEPVEIEVGLALRKMAAGIEPEAELEGSGLERRGRMP